MDTRRLYMEANDITNDRIEGLPAIFCSNFLWIRARKWRRVRTRNNFQFSAQYTAILYCEEISIEHFLKNLESSLKNLEGY